MPLNVIKTTVHYMPFQGSILVCSSNAGGKKDHEQQTATLEERLLPGTRTPSSAGALLMLHPSVTTRRPSATFQEGTEVWRLVAATAAGAAAEGGVAVAGRAAAIA